MGRARQQSGYTVKWATVATKLLSGGTTVTATSDSICPGFGGDAVSVVLTVSGWSAGQVRATVLGSPTDDVNQARTVATSDTRTGDGVATSLSAPATGYRYFFVRVTAFDPEADVNVALTVAAALLIDEGYATSVRQSSTLTLLSSFALTGKAMNLAIPLASMPWPVASLKIVAVVNFSAGASAFDIDVTATDGDASESALTAFSVGTANGTFPSSSFDIAPYRAIAISISDVATPTGTLSIYAIVPGLGLSMAPDLSLISGPVTVSGDLTVTGSLTTSSITNTNGLSTNTLDASGDATLQGNVSAGGTDASLRTNVTTAGILRTNVSPVLKGVVSSQFTTPGFDPTASSTTFTNTNLYAFHIGRATRAYAAGETITAKVSQTTNMSGATYSGLGLAKGTFTPFAASHTLTTLGGNSMNAVMNTGSPKIVTVAVTLGVTVAAGDDLWIIFGKNSSAGPACSAYSSSGDPFLTGRIGMITGGSIDPSTDAAGNTHSYTTIDATNFLAHYVYPGI